MWILVKMVDSFGIEERASSFDAVYPVTFGQEQFGKI
jgi:hypothetical protein